MENPVTIMLDDTKREIWTVLNSAKLPATILLPVVTGICSELNVAAQQELTYDRQSYEKFREKEKEEKEQ